MNSSLPIEKLVDFKGDYKYNNKVYSLIKRNQNKSFNYLKRKYNSGIIQNETLKSLKSKFSISGAFKVSSLEELSSSNRFFINNDDTKYFLYRKNNGTYEYHLRGASYMVALNPKYSVIQKLDILRKDLLLSIKSINQYKFDNTPQYKTISVVLDYQKNALITLFNSYVHKEKLGIFKLKDQAYISNRNELIKSIRISVYAYYMSLLNLLTEELLNELKATINFNNIDYIHNMIKTDFRDFSFSSKSMIRPEATHPLVLFSFSKSVSYKNKNIDFLIGLPSGGTEIACLTYELIQREYNNNCNLYLLPISFHSIKETKKNNVKINYSKFINLIPEGKKNSINKVLIVDDNSATGQTLEKVSNLIRKKMICDINCFVAEADLRRIELKIKDKNKFQKLANHNIFKHSTNILPVSKFIKPKFDIKEIYEKNQLAKYYLEKKEDYIVNKIINEVTADALLFNYQDIKDYLNPNNSILSFKHTFLSNFYSVEFIYKGRKYSSVEQAYLRQKFDTHLLERLSQKQKNELNEVLKFKGINIEKTNFATAFYDFTLPAGVLKRWSIKLKEWGLEDKNWDNRRLIIMTELLLLKFSNTKLMSKLIKTDNKYLVEGNDWNDTFWGVCDNSGRNFLGRLLMNIRAKILSGEIDQQQLTLYIRNGG